MNINLLNKNYGAPGTIDFKKGQGGMPVISISNDSANALISLFGGQILSYRVVGEIQAELLFLSKKACFNASKAIRGGIPVCWPWFGQDPEGLLRPNHGFARNTFWNVAKAEMISNAETTVTLQLPSRSINENDWAHAFDLSLVITVGKTLAVKLTTRNTGKSAFSITEALHAYFSVGDIRKTRILGLENTLYYDKLDNSRQKKQSAAITIAEEVDRIYKAVQKHLIIEDTANKRRIRIASLGSQMAIVWNPWKESTAKLADLEADDYQHFLCVETANTAPDAITIQPGHEHRLQVCYEILQET